MTCERCGGLKIAERFYATDATVSMWSYDGFRCLNCGAISTEEPASLALAIGEVRRVFRRNW